MPAQSPRIHPSAVIDAAAQLAPSVQVGPLAVILGPVRLGDGCIVGPGAQLLGAVVAGEGNQFGSGCIIGERAQHIKLHEAPGQVIIGHGNIFREHVTVHRSTLPGEATVIGNSNFFMVNSHVAHDCVVGNHIIMANGAMLGGHAIVQDHAFLSGNCGVHQNCRVGKVALLSAMCSATTDVPPFAIMEGRNRIAGVNVVGMKRSGYPHEEIQAVREAYRILLASDLLRTAAVERIERELGQIEAIRELTHFLRESRRGICLTRARRAS